MNSRLLPGLLAWIDDQRQALPESRTPVAHGKAELLRELRAELDRLVAIDAGRGASA